MSSHRLLLLAVVSTLAVGCSDGCRDSIVAQVAAPDGLHTAFLFERSCGATTGFSTQVSVVAGGRLPGGGGNVFVADTDHGAAPSAPWGGPVVSVRWAGSSTLEISYDHRARVFERLEAVNGVSIRYVHPGDA
jgi:hypothetical protein